MYINAFYLCAETSLFKFPKNHIFKFSFSYKDQFECILSNIRISYVIYMAFTETARKKV